MDFKKAKKSGNLHRKNSKSLIILAVIILTLVSAFYFNKAYKLSHLNADRVSVIVHSCNESVVRSRYSREDNSCKIYEDGQTKLHIIAVPYPNYALANDRLLVYKFSNGSYELTKNTRSAGINALYYSSWLLLIVSFLAFRYHHQQRLHYRKKIYKYNNDVKKENVTRSRIKLHKPLESSRYLKVHLYIFIILIFLPFAVTYATIFTTAAHSMARVQSSKPAEVKVTISSCYDVKFLPDFCTVTVAYTGESKEVTVANIDLYKRGQILQMYEFSDGELEETKDASWAKGTIGFTLVQLIAIFGLCYLANKSEAIKKRRVRRMNRKKVKSNE
jgi:hypothetical protein